MSFNLEVFILFNHTNPTQLPADNRIVALFCQSPRIFQIKTVFVQLNFVSFLQQPRNIKMSPNKPGLKLQIGEGNGTPLQYSCLENPMDGGAWWATGHGVTEGQTRLSDFTFPFHFHALEKEMAIHSSDLAWRIPGTGSLVGCRLWVTQSRTRLK